MNSTRKKNESGFSLVELIVASVILVAVIGILSTVLSSVQVNYARQRPRTEALNDAAAALDMMSRLIRMAGNNPGNPNPIVNLQAINPGALSNGAYRTIQIRGDWCCFGANRLPDGDTADPFENVLFTVSNNQLMKQEEGEGSASVYLDNVKDMTFTYYTSENVLIPNPPTSLALIARVDINLVIQAKDGLPMTFKTSTYVRQR